jgi:hypothetical protein
MDTPTHYTFVGSKELLHLIHADLEGYNIQTASDILDWIKESGQKTDYSGEIIATFIIDLQGNLRIHDRHSEHVVCANGKPVLSAGEIIFTFSKHHTIIISQISNQSTGYCPSPTSWHVVQNALEKIGIAFPVYFTTAFEFRVCQNCGWINIIKDDYFVCENMDCLQELPT